MSTLFHPALSLSILALCTLLIRPLILEAVKPTMSHSPAQTPPRSLTLTRVANLTQGYGQHLAFSPDGEFLVASNGAGALYLWRNLQPWQTLSRPGELLHYPLVTADSQWILAAPAVFNLATQTWEELPALTSELTAGLSEIPQGSFSSFSSIWSPDRQDLVVYTEYRPSRRLGDRADWQGPTKRLLLLQGKTRELQTVLWEGRASTGYRTLAINDRYIAAGAVSIRLWNRQTRQQVAELTQPSLVVRALDFNPTGTLLLGAGADRQVRLWETANGALVKGWKAHNDDIQALRFHPQRAILASGSGDRQLKLWTLEGQLLATETLEDGVEGLAFSFAGDFLAVAQGGPQAKILVYRLQID